MADMVRSSYIACFFASAVFAPGIAAAQLVLSEVMYDLEVGSDSGREWVEVFNSGTSPITLSEWKLFENGTNHSLTAFSGGEVLAPGAYAVIADTPQKFLEDWPLFSGVLVDSAFSLSNSGETLVLRCCGADLVDADSIVYVSEQGGAGDGHSLHRTSLSSQAFTPEAPTPGAGVLSVQGEGAPPPAVPTFSGGGSANPSAAVASLSAYAGPDRSVVRGTEVSFEAFIYDEKKQPVENVHVEWNFGDGSMAVGKRVVHTFAYAGRYAVMLSVSQYDRHASDQAVITAEDVSVRLSLIPNGGLSIENTADYPLNLSSWKFADGFLSFTFPKNSIVLPGAALRLPRETIGFFATERVVLLYPNGEEAARVQTDTPEQTPVTPPLIEEEPPMRAPEGPAAVREQAVHEIPPLAEEPAAEEVMQESQQVAAAGSVSLLPQESAWWLAALGIALLGGSAAVFLARLRSDASGWDIIDEDHNST